MPADKNWIYDPKKNTLLEVNLLSWRLSVSEIELTYDDTENIWL